MSSSINLTIENKKGLSHAIDKALDEHFNKDIKISDANQWQSIFDIITANEQAQQTQANQKQFDNKKDTDIKNGRHYVVNEGIYVLTSDTWSKIVDFVKTNVLHKQEAEVKQQAEPKSAPETEPVELQTAPAEEVSAEETPTEDENNTKSYTSVEENLVTEEVQAKESSETETKINEFKSKICEYLEMNIEDFNKKSAIFKSDVLRKYATILDFLKNNPDCLQGKDKDEYIKTRIHNYVQGWKYHQFETEVLYQKKDKNYKIHEQGADDTTMYAAYQALAKQYIEYYDENGDGNIDVAEMLLAESYNDQRSPYYERLKGSDAYIKAQQICQNYKDGKLMPNIHATPEEETLFSILQYFNKYDSNTTDVNRADDIDDKTDGVLELTDIITMLYYQANHNEDDGIISASELKTTSSKTIIDVNKQKEKIMETYNLLFVPRSQQKKPS